MERIKQEHGTGCGIACVAMLTRKTYQEVWDTAAQRFNWLPAQRSFYTTSAHLNELLSHFGIHSEKGHAVRNWQALPDVAIVAINYYEKSDSWHWVVFSREDGAGLVLDPRSKREIRTDFGRMRLRSYISIDTA